MAPFRIVFAFIIAAALLIGWPMRPSAHEVPNEVTVLAFVKPEGKTLTFLVRAPMESLRDVDVPLKPSGFLDLSRIDAPLQHAAQVWIRDFVEIYENGTLRRASVTGLRPLLCELRPGAGPYPKRAAAD
jgi:hypothetical protein